ncbi:MAG: zinc transport system substrate-binding protein [Methanohalophilus sp.]|nr:MAG: zinc transport system substrate-binding protein [Methanohalophilus sp.]
MREIIGNIVFWPDTKKVFLLLLTIAIIATTGCTEENSSDQPEKTTVVVSIPPQAEFVEKVGGEHVETIVMIPPGASPATYEPTSSQLKELSKAEIYVKVQETLENKSGNSFMVYHPAWGYFAERYDLNMVPIETEGKEASARQLSEVITFAKQENITIIFVQSQFSTQSAEAVAEEIDGKVVKVDPLARNYTDNMYKVTEAFREGLK